MMWIVREVFWLCVKYDCRITASHIAGDLNVLNDRLSRLCEPWAAVEAFDLLNVMCDSVFAVNHMSLAIFVGLQNYWGQSLMRC